MGLGVSLILVAAGAILAWGVTDEPSGLNLDAIGAVLIVIGIVGFILSLLLWRSWWGPGYFSRETYVEGGPTRSRYGGWGRRRETYVEEEPPPGGPPPGGPPPA
ncbi:MAG TPA: hypothetical protein VE615_06625 [Gaiellaceae bacterium]|jgi:hypothetical protein|nr:hypothetical protein [Gaiellaceae bacterium]